MSAPLDESVESIIEVRRSPRRRRTVSAYRDEGRTVVLIPARFSKAEERRWVADMIARLDARDGRARRGPRASDAALASRARSLSGELFGGRATPASVRWVDNMTTRWGSCTPADGTIRISSRVRAMPTWVLDYVLVHELAHLIAPGHDRRFWALVDRYPRTERARGYLEGVAAAAHWQPSDDDVLSGDRM
ncbi:MAG TPA: M48 family metallopeptidase [Mycobacteriales bacterium]